MKELDQETPWGQVTLAVETDGSRHFLVPILSSTRIRAGLDGPGLGLKKRTLEDETSHTTYADLSCYRPELLYLFDDLCSDVLRELAELPQQPLKAVYQVVDRWRSLFDRPLGVLSDQAASGLYGELLVLRRLLELDPSAHRMWVGPLGSHHDFEGEKFDIEVKATTLSTGRRVQVHGLDQLAEPQGGRLLLAWFRFSETTGGQVEDTLMSIVEEVLSIADDEPAIRTLLAQAGYIPGTLDANDLRGYVVADERWYEVDDKFPRLTRALLDGASIPETVVDADYSIDLTAEPPAPLSYTTVETYLQTAKGDK